MKQKKLFILISLIVLIGSFFYFKDSNNKYSDIKESIIDIEKLKIEKNSIKFIKNNKNKAFEILTKVFESKDYYEEEENQLGSRHYFSKTTDNKTIRISVTLKEDSNYKTIADIKLVKNND
ncbi:hypothetical protein WG909_08010 [Peptostreptococcaceae bacterium AGR-M142]